MLDQRDQRFEEPRLAAAFAVEHVEAVECLAGRVEDALRERVNPGGLHAVRRRLVWPNSRLAAMTALLDGVAALQQLPVNGRLGSLALWARETGPELWEMATVAADGESHRQRLAPLRERLFEPPVLRGDELATECGLEGPQIGAALRRLLA